ncbi:hydroxymethylglutaryl-CoA synthase [Arctopsyche grandis]|uniref:hydroxymethylglutaryl-CoA synthase n=1 Tax=Arctopsyche grandis TaxID=121162 RepID=UPI00406D9D54
MSSWPKDVGVLAVEQIFPAQYVDQTQLEEYDGVSGGKYTLGLGQGKMGFCTDREDVQSFCLTVLHNLVKNNNLKYSQIGRLEVGTETIIDKSKSVKTVLMQLFEEEGVTDVEGIDTTNACYGGTAALFNAINWVESSTWDGRYAVVIAADLAVYPAGTARPTGGAGAVGMLIGPNAPLVFDRGIRATYMKHAYDFYKPNLASEYAIVDGKLSIQCYLSALDNCYQLYRKKAQKLDPTNVGIESLDAMIFHSPYCKLVQKSFARLIFNDYKLATDDVRNAKYPGLDKFKDVNLEDTYFDRDVEKAFMTISNDAFEKKTKPSLLLANQIGNMYTSSVHSGLVSLLVSKEPSELVGHRIGLFSYGSGLASSMYSISVTKDLSKLTALMKNLKNVKPLLEKRVKVSPQKFTEIMETREKNYLVAPFEPVSSINELFDGTYYLKHVDKVHRRSYGRYVSENV